ncbi:MAG: hypothetical protein O9350_03105 [Microcystis sp. LE19-388.1G]|nr:hypothetical protein [Microcystis sp. LE19-388.1G]
MNWHHARPYLGFAAKSFSWGQGVGKWGSGEAVLSPYYPKTLSPYLFPDDRRPTTDCCRP